MQHHFQANQIAYISPTLNTCPVFYTVLSPVAGGRLLYYCTQCRELIKKYNYEGKLAARR